MATPDRLELEQSQSRVSMARSGTYAAAQNPPSSRAPNVVSMRDVMLAPEWSAEKKGMPSANEAGRRRIEGG